MKKTLLNQWLKSACIAVLGFVSVSASAEDEPDATFDFKGTISTSAPLTVGEVTATVSQTTAYGNGANIYRTDSGYDWMLALESERNIVRIEYTVTGGAYNLTTLDVGVFGAQSSTEGVWTGSAKKVELHADYTSYFDEYVTDAKVWLEAVDNSEEIAGTPVMVTLPYSATFDAAEDRAKVAAIDANADGQTFRFDQEESNYFAVLNTQNISYQANDYLVLCKASLVANKPYTLSIDGQSPSGMWHYYEIVAGLEPTKEAMTTMLTYAWQNVFETTWTTKTQNEFKVETSGDYYIALRCYSYAGNGKVYFDNFTLDAVPADMPAKATNLTAVAGENGALSATVGFTMPTATYGMDEYASDKSLTYTVKNNDVLVETGTAVAGAQVSVTDDQATNGTNYYSVVISDGANGDSEKAQVSVYVGVDRPYAPSNVQMTVDGNSITMTWEAPTEGYNRGYLGEITYNVYPYRNYTMGEAINESPISETSYTFEYDLSVGVQCEMKFCVVAVTAGGSSNAGYTPSVSAGAPYELPFVEDFLGNADQYTIQSIVGSGGGYDWGDEAYMGSYFDDTVVEFITGKISLNHYKANASVSCKVDNDNTTSFEILVVDNTGTEYVIETIETPSTYYQTYTCLLNGDYVDAPWIRFVVRAHFTEAYQYAFINNVSIEVASTDITVSEAGYTTYYNSAKGYIMPEGLTGYLISSNDLKLEVAYEAGANVPAGEPLVLQGNAGKYELLLTNNNGYTKVDFAENILAGTDTEMTTPLSFYATYTGASADNCHFFGLSLNAAGDLESVGFYYMNETGSAFTNGAHKAYLCVPKNMLEGASEANAIHGFSFDELEAGLSTAIGQVNATEDAARCYNLSGVRVNSNAKGLIIRDGKKMLNK